MNPSSTLASMALAAAVLQPYEAVEPHMGTLFRIKLYAGDQAQAQKAFQAAFARIAGLDEMLSDYTATSELSLLSGRAVGQAVPVSGDLFKVLSAAQKLSEETDGAFDVTVGPLTHLWRQARRDKNLLNQTAVNEARGHCGFQKLHLDAAAHSAKLDQAGMQLDVGGIAKGYAADEALIVLAKHGIHSALVAASGDLAFSDAPPGETGWKIGLDSLDSASAPFTRVILLANAAVSTSGSSEQSLEIGGVHYSHIIDPKIGWGLTRWISTTVVAARGMDADAMATAINVLGAQRGLAFIEKQPGAAALIVTREPLAILESTGFRKLRR